jgi:hypothetical protein
MYIVRMDKRSAVLAWLETADIFDDSTAAALRDALRGEVEAIRHREVEDCWYSCPKALDADGNSACCDERQTECNCGADSQIERIHAATVGAQ